MPNLAENLAEKLAFSDQNISSLCPNYNIGL
jgi:hypothetical protein